MLNAKWVAAFSSVLLLGLVLAGVAGAGPPGKNTVYVDDDHKCDGNKPCVGTIQKGIDRVKVGGTVVVYGGLYEENVVVDKSVRIEAANPLDKPVVDGEALGPTVTVLAWGVSIASLDVRNGVDGLLVTGDDFSLEDTDVTANSDNGVEIVGSSGSEVGPGNVLSFNGGSGLYATGTADLSVHHNTAEGNGAYGIYLGDSVDADVSSNTVSDNELDGIFFYMVDPSAIFGNTALRNRNDGINVSSSQDITVSGNTANLNGGDGIAFWEVDPSYILGNWVGGNGDDGIEVFRSDFITVSDNSASTNGGDGISFWEVDPSVILNNWVSGNSRDGVNVSRSQDIIVQNNDVSTNGGDGIAFWEVDPSYILGNSVGGNTNDGVRVTTSNYITVGGNSVSTNGGDGISFWEVDPSFIQDNDLQGNGGGGVDLLDSIDILVKDNEVKGNAWGIRMTRGHGNQVFQNNFIDNTISLSVVDAPDNTWDSGCASWPYVVGNFWSDFTGGDDGTETSRCGERRVAGDGIGDAGTTSGFGGADWYPVLQPSGWIAIQERLTFAGEIDPGTDEPSSKGKWVQVKIFVPKDSGYHAKNIKKSSLRLAGNLGFVDWKQSPSSTSEGPDGSTVLHVKFDRQAWFELVFDGEWCYAILGQFQDGQTFIATDCVTIDPP